MELQTRPDQSLSFGSTALDAQDFIPPRVKIVQAMSDERNNGVEEGHFYNTLTGEDYGDELRFIPITAFKNRILLVRQERMSEINKALKDGGHKIKVDGDGLQCRSLDMVTGNGTPGLSCAECPLSQWDGNFPPHCTETYNISAITDEGDLIILGFSKSSAKVGKKMFSMMRLVSGAPWKHIYSASSTRTKNDLGSFYVPTIRKDEPTPSELMAVAAEFAQQLGAMVIDVSPDGVEGGEPADDGPAPWEGEEASA